LRQSSSWRQNRRNVVNPLTGPSTNRNVSPTEYQRVEALSRCHVDELGVDDFALVANHLSPLLRRDRNEKLRTDDGVGAGTGSRVELQVDVGVGVGQRVENTAVVGQEVILARR
jgi:hypothetical protein